MCSSTPGLYPLGASSPAPVSRYYQMPSPWLRTTGLQDEGSSLSLVFQGFPRLRDIPVLSFLQSHYFPSRRAVLTLLGHFVYPFAFLFLSLWGVYFLNKIDPYLPAEWPAHENSVEWMNKYMIEKAFYLSICNRVMQHYLKYNFCFFFLLPLSPICVHLLYTIWVPCSFNYCYLCIHLSLSLFPHQTGSLDNINKYLVLTWYLLYSRFCGK